MAWWHPGLKARRTSGFNLIEVALAIFILAIGVLGVLSVFSFSLESTRHAAWTAEAVGLCRQAIEEIRSRNMPFQDDKRSVLNENRPATWTTDARTGLHFLNAPPLTNLPADPNFRRKTRIRLLSTDENDHLSQIAEVQVTVYWMDKHKLRQVTVTAHHRRP